MATASPANNIADLLYEKSVTTPSDFAVRTKLIELTFAEMYQRVCAVARELQLNDVTKGDVVALLLPDPLEHLTATMAVVFQGAAILSLSKSMSVSLRRTLIKQTSAKFVLFSDKDDLEGLDTAITTTLDFRQFVVVAACDLHPPVAVEENDPWQIVHGSGSTGVPKLLLATHRSQKARFKKAKDYLPIEIGQTFLSMTSIQFSASKGMALQAWAVGACVYLGKQGQIDYIEAVTSGAVDAIFATPFHIQMMLQQAYQLRNRPYERLSALMVTSAPVPMSMRADIKRYLTDNLYVLWGTNEASFCSMTSLDSVFTTDETVGYPLPWVTIQVVDERGVELAPGDTGHIRVKTDALAGTYQGDAKSTESAFRDGWFYPKDIGQLTEDGQLIYLGRSDHMIMVGGVNVNPRQVEAILLEDPSIYDAHVTAIDHPTAGQSPVALLVPAEGTSLDLNKIVNSVREKIGAHALHFAASVARLPRTDQGKLPKTEVERLTNFLFRSAFKRKVPTPTEIIFSFTVEDSEFDVEHVLTWLEMLAPGASRDFIAADCYRGETTGELWLQLVLSVTHLLLCVAGLPLFDRIDVVRCVQDTTQRNKWHTALALSRRNIVPVTVLKAVIPQAFSMSSAIVHASPSIDAHRTMLFNHINETVQKTLPKTFLRGHSSFHILAAALQLNIRAVALPNRMIQLGWGKHSRIFDRSGIQRDSHIGSLYASDKFAGAALLREAGLPTPIHVKATTLEAAEKAFLQLKSAVVLKPVDGERGEGVSTNVTLDTLKAAFTNAKKYSRTGAVLVEKKVAGVCHRLFIVNGEMLYAVRRLPIGVYADGLSTINQLVKQARDEDQARAPWNRLKIPALDELAKATLSRLGHEEEFVLPAGHFVPLRPIESTSWGGIDEDVTQIIHPDNVNIAIHASKIMGLTVAGVDIISEDISHSWLANDAIINEVNYAPLLGGGAISRAKIPEYLNRCLPNLGQIPIRVFVGGDGASKQAWKYFEAKRKQVDGVFLIERGRAYSPLGEDLKLLTTSLSELLQALSLNSDVAELLICAQTVNCLYDLQSLNSITSCTFAPGEDISAIYQSTVDAKISPRPLLDALLAKQQ